MKSCNDKTALQVVNAGYSCLPFRDFIISCLKHTLGWIYSRIHYGALAVLVPTQKVLLRTIKKVLLYTSFITPTTTKN